MEVYCSFQCRMVSGTFKITLYSKTICLVRPLFHGKMVVSDDRLYFLSKSDQIGLVFITYLGYSKREGRQLVTSCNFCENQDKQLAKSPCIRTQANRLSQIFSPRSNHKAIYARHLASPILQGNSVEFDCIPKICGQAEHEAKLRKKHMTQFPYFMFLNCRK